MTLHQPSKPAYGDSQAAVSMNSCTGHAIADELIVFKERLMLQRSALLAVAAICPLRRQQESRGMRGEIAHLGIFAVHFFCRFANAKKFSRAQVSVSSEIEWRGYG
jgi:hypothetical protein